MKEVQEQISSIKSELVSQYLSSYFKASGGKETSDTVKNMINKATISELHALIQHLEPCIEKKYSMGKEVPNNIQNEINEIEKKYSLQTEESISEENQALFEKAFESNLRFKGGKR